MIHKRTWIIGLVAVFGLFFGTWGASAWAARPSDLNQAAPARPQSAQPPVQAPAGGFTATPTASTTSIATATRTGTPASATTTATVTPTCTTPVLIYGVTATGNQLVSFNSNAPTVILSTVTITGLQGGETLLEIDFRPANGLLYGLGSTSRLYTIVRATGVATQVGSGPFTPALSGTEFGFDFNPVSDRIRVVSDLDQNLRLNPDTGAVAVVDTNLAYAPGDPNAGQNPNVTAAGYTNSVPGAGSTLLYVGDSALDILATQNPPNNGTLNTVGGFGADVSPIGDLDIEPTCGQAFAVVQPVLAGGPSILTLVNLQTGGGTVVGPIGPGLTLRSLAIVLPVQGTVTPTASVVATTTRTATASVTGTAQASATRSATAVLPTITVAVPTITSVVPTFTGTAVVPTVTASVVAPSVTASVVVPSATASVVVPTIAGTPPTATQSATPRPPTSTPTVCPIQFNDVDQTNPFYVYVRCLACRGIISGYSDGTFRPYSTVTRGQVAKIVANSAGINDAVPSGQQTFTDVPSSNPFYIYIERLTARGIVSGYADGTFRPFNPVTRGQLAKIDANAAGYSDPISGQTFADVPPSDPFYVYVERASLHGVISGYGCDNVSINPCTGQVETCDAQNRPYFRTCATATRGQTAKIVANTFFPNCNVPTTIVYGVTTSNRLVSFNAVVPGTLQTNVAISGLGGDNVLGIDMRPATGQLYLLGSSSRLYTVNPTTGAATAVGSGPFTPALNGLDFGFDFNPTVDRIRIVSDNEQNLRLNPDTGAVAATDAALAYAPGDPNAGANPHISGAAYTNNFVGGGTTTLYDIDTDLDTLVTQVPPNNGTLNTVGPLGVNTNGLVGFDISGATNTAYAVLNTGTAQLYTINLGSGAATLVGPIGGTETITDITVGAPSMARR